MDAIDRIIIDNSPDRARHILIIDAPHLVAPATERATRVSVWCDDVRNAALVPSELLIERFDASLRDVDLVWLRLPTSLGALEEYAELVSHWASRQVMVIAAERNKYLNHAMNPVLEACFEKVHASLGQQKCRALIAVGARRSDLSYPRRRLIDTPAGEIDLWWHGATFAAGRVDEGTTLLLPHLTGLPHGTVCADLGCGSGVISACLSTLPGTTVHALDVSAAAIDSTMRTCAGRDVVTHWGTDLDHLAPGSLDVIVTNPPFHRGTAKDSTPTIGLFRQAGRLLRSGGELLCVFNSHLPWISHLEQQVGPTSVLTRERGYVVSRSVHR